MTVSSTNQLLDHPTIPSGLSKLKKRNGMIYEGVVKCKLIKVGTAAANFEASISSLWRLTNPYESLISVSNLQLAV